ncbi:SusD/RagB family nutrient-binding outer membrane lipoprotein [Arenibacter aquaticus]|uniref:SusD/RagB family nutrient-binding outer membrane lipoprotein n=1 Tax=Arenibacter aquaticus TaxID=2489054 RepID=A0A3S0D6A7_9FLAO|nr:SusD/RagB family nutrient-binding outer membrane lipoprotein [Arenibacter aquaticus]RTE53982.1 SusD/RagB family nutrient-binding outer membrane lipoprotein [Arenibacter aquaticus]
MKKLIYLFTCIIGTAACTDGFDEMNIDPNNPVKASSQSILLAAQRTITHTLLDDNNVFTTLNWVQYHAKLGYSEQTYDIDWNTDAFFNNQTAVLNNLELLRKQAVSDEHANYEAVAIIMKTWVFSYFTDMYGDIPYSEALKAMDENILYPKFDTQESIYNDLVAKLKEADAKIELEPGVADIDGASDIFCQGDMLKWKKFANSLRARLLLRMSESAADVAKAGLEEIFQNPDTYPVLEDNLDNVGVKFIGETSGVNTSIFVQQTNNGQVRAVSTTLVDLLCANNDPRRTIMLNATKKSVDSVTAGVWTEYEYQGVPPAVLSPFNSFQINDVSTVGDAISLDYSRPIDVLTYGEVLFIKAEAASKGYNVGSNVADIYVEGVKASMEKWGVTDQGTVDQYLALPFVAFDSSRAQEQIITQRYIEQFHQALNTFAMIRRSGFSGLKWVSIGFSIENGYPDRIPYSHNMRGGNPNFETIAPQLTKNLWGNMWFAKDITVTTAAAYEEPVVYKFIYN